MNPKGSAHLAVSLVLNTLCLSPSQVTETLLSAKLLCLSPCLILMFYVQIGALIFFNSCFFGCVPANTCIGVIEKNILTLSTHIKMRFNRNLSLCGNLQCQGRVSDHFRAENTGFDFMHDIF